ncbi:hypothetical protein WKI68_08955 [Streptomyces sp. MS1.HAVA.3]|uniref:Uncharacterized protein n=1 Tax=Streptomyces caledonius TaxID=3134107 RepID=A0ABU8U226_9ACTN
MNCLARAVLALFCLLVAAVAVLAFAVRSDERPEAFTAADVTGVWLGDRGGRLEVLPDGRARLSGSGEWTCVPGQATAATPAEGSWVLARHSDEDPGILVKFSADGPQGADGDRGADGAPGRRACSDWFAVHGSGKGNATGDGADVWARFLAHRTHWERYRRATTG